MVLQMLEQSQLGLPRAGDEHFGNADQGFSHLVIEVLVFRRLAAADRAAHDVQMRMLLGHDDGFFDIRRIDEQHAGLSMIDPDNCMTMCHDETPFESEYAETTLAALIRHFIDLA
jgi:hypothetical protein